METFMTVITIVTAVVTGASIILIPISKYTANKTDDMVAGWLLSIKRVLEKFALNL